MIPAASVNSKREKNHAVNETAKEKDLWRLVDEDRRLEQSTAHEDIGRRVAIAATMQRYIEGAPRRHARDTPQYDLVLIASMLAAQRDRLKSRLR